jgi:acyl-CoA hydrolase
MIRQNDRVTAINSALSIDLTGQVCADSIGTKHYSGVGGQIDFIRGAGHSVGGKPIIAIPSVTNKGVSKICPTLLEGSGVVSTRSNMHWVVTEYGAVNLYGKTLQERARLLISIAPPIIVKPLIVQLLNVLPSLSFCKKINDNKKKAGKMAAFFLSVFFPNTHNQATQKN